MLFKPFGKAIEILIQCEVVKRVVIKLRFFSLFDFFLKVANELTIRLIVS